MPAECRHFLYTETMLFRLFRIRKNVKDIRNDAGGFAGDQVVDVVTGILAIPLLLSVGALVLFFILGYTALLGGPFGFFKILFVVGASVSFLLFLVVRPLFRFIRAGTKEVVDRGVQKIKEVRNEIE